MSIPIPEGSVVITPTEVYKEVRDTHQAVQQMAGKFDTFLDTQGDHESRLRRVDGLPEDVRELKEVSEAQGRSIENLDRRISRAAGIAIGVSTALSGTSGLIIWAISHH